MSSASTPWKMDLCLGSNWKPVNDVEAPSGASTTDGETFSVADRSVTIEDPDWSDVERDEAGGPIPPFDLPELVVSEGG